MDRFTVIPYVKLENEQWSIPNHVMAYVWDKIVEMNYEKLVFWGGGIDTFFEFLKWLRDPKNFPVVTCDTESIEPVFLAWLNGVEAHHAIGHFCAIGRYSPIHAKAILDYWADMHREDGSPVLNTLLGFIPETNKRAIHMIERLGFTNLGTVPAMCELAFEGRTVGATFLYKELNGGENG